MIGYKIGTHSLSLSHVDIIADDIFYSSSLKEFVICQALQESQNEIRISLCNMKQNVLSLLLEVTASSVKFGGPSFKGPIYYLNMLCMDVKMQVYTWIHQAM